MKTSKSIKPSSFGVMQPFGEKNDCAVRAAVNITGMQYTEVHKVFEKNGRKQGKGTYLVPLFNSMKDLGFKPIIFGGNIFAPEAKRNIHSSDYSYHEEKVTLGKVIKDLPNAKFVAIVKGHATSVVKSEIIDFVSIGKAKEVYAIFYKEDEVFN